MKKRDGGIESEKGCGRERERGDRLVGGEVREGERDGKGR